MVGGVTEFFGATAQHAEHRGWATPATPADPGDFEAVGLGADDIEAVRGDEEYFRFRNFEHRLDEGVTRPVRLVCSVPDQFLQHSRAAVRQNCELASRERGERLACFGIGVEVEIILHQGCANSVVGLDPGRAHCEVE